MELSTQVIGIRESDGDMGTIEKRMVLSMKETGKKTRFKGRESKF